MNEEKIVEFLVRVPLFHGLNKRQLQKLANRIMTREYEPGQEIVTQGKGGEGIFIIASGSVQVVRERRDGSKITLNSFGPTDFFGELALLDEGRRTASVVAAEKTTCLSLTRWDFLGILKDDAEMAIVVAEELARRFRAALEAL
jgi:CRP-like cAMP-binding protein